MVEPAPILIAATRRSGSTWLMNLLNADHGRRSIFEPLHAVHVPLFGAFRTRQYLREDNTDSIYIEPINKLLRGEIRNEWTDKFNTSDARANGLIIKFIRANMMLGWLRQQAPDAKLVLLFRHPLAVASSSVRYKWPIEMTMYSTQAELMMDHLTPFHEIMDGARTDFEKHVVSWCIDMLVPLVTLQPDSYLPVFYEALVKDPQQELPALFSALDLELTGAAWQMMDQPSTLAQADSREAIQRGDDMTQRWKQFVTREEARAGWKIVDAFGLLDLYPREVEEYQT